MAFQRPKGTQDHLPDGSPKLRPDTSARWQQFVTDTAAEVLERAGAQFIGLPIFEEAEVIQRGVGGSTDIVRKEMFTVTYQTNIIEILGELRMLRNRIVHEDSLDINRIHQILNDLRVNISENNYRRDESNTLAIDTALLEATDILNLLKDTRPTDTFVLRPEATAGLVRAYLENGLKQLPSPLKLWTHGPMFRAENVQRGRLRQFHQVDYEVIGSADPLVDAEAIQVMVQTVTALGVRGVEVKLGSIGDPADRGRYNAYLRELFGPHAERLSDDSKDRLIRNPMRILDSKSKDDQSLISELSVRPMLDFLGPEAQAHFDAVRAYLDAWGVAYSVDPSIVRGLDYYRRTAWELHHANIGAKSALGGGGRYDGLAEQLGGPETPGIGWAFGVERMLLALEQEGATLPAAEGPLLFVAALDAKYVVQAAQIALGARSVGRAEFGYRALKPGPAFKEADRKGATYAALIGSDEAARGSVALKHLASGEQHELPQAGLNAYLLENR